MADAVVDTSTVVKWYIPEQHHEQARALRDDLLNGNVDCSHVRAVAATSHCDDVIVQLGAYVGLRAFDTAGCTSVTNFATPGSRISKTVTASSITHRGHRHTSGQDSIRICVLNREDQYSS